jgi:hypothetical protein
VLGIRGGITRLRGQWRAGDQDTPNLGGLQGRWLMPLLHPSYLLRNPSQAEGSPRWHTVCDLAELRRRFDAACARCHEAASLRGVAARYPAWDERLALLTIGVTAFGRAISEVGAVMIVGGNIDGFTRVMTTSIALETSKGDLPLALALGLVLLAVVGAINALIGLVQWRASAGSGQGREAPL